MSAACPTCGHTNEHGARFCSACGTALVRSTSVREQRKVVTVLFCDLVGSTALGESTDPEALRARMRRYFEDLRAIIQRPDLELGSVTPMRAPELETARSEMGLPESESAFFLSRPNQTK